MNTQEFTRVYNESRNGANNFIRHPLSGGKLIFSDGVEELANTGCHWLLDIAATELVQVMRRAGQGAFGILYVNVADNKADLRLELDDDVVSWKRHIDYTDMPDGKWTLYLSYDYDIAMILPSEY